MFTTEHEGNNLVRFLDTKEVRKNDSTFVTDWYVKPTTSERYINYNSFYSKIMQINIVLCLKTSLFYLLYLI